MGSSHVFTKSESTNPDFFFTKFAVCFYLLKTDSCLRIKIYKEKCRYNFLFFIEKAKVFLEPKSVISGST